MEATKKERTKHLRGGGLLLTEAELAAAIEEKERTIRTWWHARVIPARILGHRTVRFNLNDVLDALSKRTVKAVADRNGK
jgi:hypothetical protein